MARRKNRATGKQKAKPKPKVNGPKKTPPKGRPTRGRRERAPSAGFWGQPWWFAVWAALAGLFALILFVGSAYLAVDDRGMTTAPPCRGDAAQRHADTDCLLEVSGRVEGPSYNGRRQPGYDWRFTPSHSGDAGAAEVTVVGSGNDTLAEWRSGEIVGLYWHGRLVAFEDPATGERVASDAFGMTEPVLMALLGVVALSVLVFLLRPRHVGDRWVQGAAAVGLPAAVAALTFALGNSVAWAFGLGGVALAALLGWRWHRRHYRSTAQTARSSASMIR